MLFVGSNILDQMPKNYQNSYLLKRKLLTFLKNIQILEDVKELVETLPITNVLIMRQKLIESLESKDGRVVRKIN